MPVVSTIKTTVISAHARVESILRKILVALRVPQPIVDYLLSLGTNFVVFRFLILVLLRRRELGHTKLALSLAHLYSSYPLLEKLTANSFLKLNAALVPALAINPYKSFDYMALYLSMAGIQEFCAPYVYDFLKYNDYDVNRAKQAVFCLVVALVNHFPPKVLSNFNMKLLGHLFENRGPMWKTFFKCAGFIVAYSNVVSLVKQRRFDLSAPSTALKLAALREVLARQKLQLPASVVSLVAVFRLVDISNTLPVKDVYTTYLARMLIRDRMTNYNIPSSVLTLLAVNLLMYNKKLGNATFLQKQLDVIRRGKLW